MNKFLELILVIDTLVHVHFRDIIDSSSDMREEENMMPETNLLFCVCVEGESCQLRCCVL